jgi:type IV secretory pathway VirB4 component
MCVIWVTPSCSDLQARVNPRTLALIAAQLRRYQGMSIYCFDKGLSMYPLTKAVGGQHFTVAGDDESLSFCPLQFLHTKGDRAWVLEWICLMVELKQHYRHTRCSVTKSARPLLTCIKADQKRYRICQ